MEELEKNIETSKTEYINTITEMKLREEKLRVEKPAEIEKIKGKKDEKKKRN